MMDQKVPDEPDETIIERRELRFSAGALRHMIGWLLQTQPSHGLPSGPPVAVTLLPDENRIEVVYGEAPNVRPIPLKADSLGALLIAYCIRARIPLRRVARKEVRVGTLYVALVFYVEHRQAPTKQVIEMPPVREPPVLQ